MSVINYSKFGPILGDDNLQGLSGTPGIGFKLTVGGDYDIQNKQLKNVADPTDDQDAATKKYVDDSITNQTLEEVLINGNSAGANNIDMNEQNIININKISSVGDVSPSPLYGKIVAKLGDSSKTDSGFWLDGDGGNSIIARDSTNKGFSVSMVDGSSLEIASITTDTSTFYFGNYNNLFDVSGNSINNTGSLSNYFVMNISGNNRSDLPLNMNNHKIINCTDPTNAQDVATKNYVDNTPNPTLNEVLIAGNDANTNSIFNAGRISNNLTILNNNSDTFKNPFIYSSNTSESTGLIVHANTDNVIPFGDPQEAFILLMTRNTANKRLGFLQIDGDDNLALETWTSSATKGIKFKIWNSNPTDNAGGLPNKPTTGALKDICTMRYSDLLMNVDIDMNNNNIINFDQLTTSTDVAVDGGTFNECVMYHRKDNGSGGIWIDSNRNATAPTGIYPWIGLTADNNTLACMFLNSTNDLRLVVQKASNPKMTFTVTEAAFSISGNTTPTFNSAGPSTTIELTRTKFLVPVELDVSNNKIINVSTPTNANDAVNKDYADTRTTTTLIYHSLIYGADHNFSVSATQNISPVNFSQQFSGGITYNSGVGFTVPSVGMYLITFSGLFDRNGTNLTNKFDFRILKNASVNPAIAATTIDGPSVANTSFWINLSGAVYCAANDVIGVWSYSNSALNNGPIIGQNASFTITKL